MMSKDVEITVVQKPVSVNFTCPHCYKDIVIDFDKFEGDTGFGIYDLLMESVEFECPECKEVLETNGVELS